MRQDWVWGGESELVGAWCIVLRTGGAEAVAVAVLWCG